MNSIERFTYHMCFQVSMVSMLLLVLRRSCVNSRMERIWHTSPRLLLKSSTSLRARVIIQNLVRIQYRNLTLYLFTRYRSPILFRRLIPIRLGWPSLDLPNRRSHWCEPCWYCWYRWLREPSSSLRSRPYPPKCCQLWYRSPPSQWYRNGWVYAPFLGFIHYNPPGFLMLWTFVAIANAY